jgi:peptide/nickel transport system substrate-binding protein
MKMPVLILALALAACASPPPQPSASATAQSQPSAPKTIIASVANAITGFAPMGLATSTGNMVNYVELHSNGLVTGDAQGRPVPQLAKERPSLDAGTTRVLPDGRMTTAYVLRTDATWHDGRPFTAGDVAFGFKVHSNPQLPFNDRSAVSRMESVAAVDPTTVLITWKSPSYLSDGLGVGILCPLPAHLLEDDYAAGDMPKFQNLPYWTSQYVHTGPFRLVRFEQGAEAVFEAYGGYFLGRPRVDTVVIKQFLDRNAVYAALLSGDVHLTVEMFDAVTANALKDRWDIDGGGAVRTTEGGASFLAFQFAPEYVHPADLLDPGIRRALFLATDRPALSDLAYAGRLTPGGEAKSILPASDRLYSYVADMYAAMANDPPRAAQAFANAGWVRGSDGFLANAQGRRLEANIRSTRENWGAAAVDMWRRAGVDATLHVTTNAEAQNREYQQSYSAVDFGGSGTGDRIFNRFNIPDIPSERTGYAGNNRGHYANPQLTALIDQYRSSLREAERGQIVRQIAELVGEDLPLLNLTYIPIFATVRKEVRALEDLSGGNTGIGAYFGSYTRTSHLWDRA